MRLGNEMVKTQNIALICGIAAILVLIFFVSGNQERKIPVPVSSNQAVSQVNSTAIISNNTAYENSTPRERIIALWSMGGHAERNLGLDINLSNLDLTQKYPWEYFIANEVQSVIDKGISRIQIHNPFGTPGGKPMQLTQYLQLQQKKQRKPSRGMEQDL